MGFPKTMAQITLDYTKKMDTKETSVIRTVLRNEVTWVITFIGITIGFFNYVVIPLNKMQIQLSQIQSDQAKISANYDTLQTAVNTLNTSVGILKSRLDNLTKK